LRRRRTCRSQSSSAASPPRRTASTPAPGSLGPCWAPTGRGRRGSSSAACARSRAPAAINLDEEQRALAVFTRGLAAAQAAGRGDLLARLRSGRARALSDLGRRDEARAELERARRDAEKAGDRLTLTRILNDLAIEDAQSGDLPAAERLFRQALVVARAASDGIREGAILHNLAGLASVRGRPDLAEPRLRRAIAIFRERDSRRRLGNSLSDLAVALQSLGKPAEADSLLAEALALLREVGDDTSAAYVLFHRASFDIERARLGGVEAAAREIESAAQASGNRTDLAVAELLRGRAAAARGDLAAARSHLTAARRMLHESGEGDVEAEAGLALAAAELDGGQLEAAARAAEEAVAAFRGRGDNQLVFRADALLAVIAARAGRLAEAEQRLASLGPGAEARPMIAQRIALLEARAAVSKAKRAPAQARRDLETAVALAQASERKLDELRLRLRLAEVNQRAGNPAAA